MRIIKIVFAIIGTLVVIVMAIGVTVPTFEYGNSIDVNAPAERCWTVFHDTSKMKNWNDGFKSLVQTKGDTLENTAEYRLTIDQGEIMVMNQKIVEINTPKFISYELTNDVLKSEYTYSFDEHGSNTAITTKYKVTGNNIFMKAILFLSKSHLARADQETLQRLKTEVETTN